MGVFAMMLLHVHVAIAAANLAENKCAALRAQNAQLVAQLASRDAELSRLRSELAASDAGISEFTVVPLLD